jgi:hypothetical protein
VPLTIILIVGNGSNSPRLARIKEIYYTGVILRDFSPEGSRAHRHNFCEEKYPPHADPSQAQDDPIIEIEEIAPLQLRW